MELKKKQQRLENIVSRINNSGNSLTGKLKKSVYIIPLVWFAGALSPEYQEEYLEKAGFRKENAKYLTISNATIFGMGISLARYYGGVEASESLENISGLLGTLVGTANFFYNFLHARFDSLQSGGRILYSLVTGKPAISISMFGIGGTYLKKGIKYLKNKRNKNQKQDP